jgi:hypothetical protein
MLVATVAVLLLSVGASPDPDPDPPRGSCTVYVEHYRELLRARAEADHAITSGEPPPSASVARAQTDAEALFRLLQPEIMASCLSTNRSEYQCVTDAGTYSTLDACQIRSLPLVPDDATVAQARARMEADRVARAPAKPAIVVEDWIARGEVQPSPGLTRAALDERRDAAAAAEEREQPLGGTRGDDAEAAAGSRSAPPATQTGARDGAPGTPPSQ